ncbi:heterokaryon incompatibility protein-domain-containing protein [Xylaria curta]|nr:heterokaryon incompatibility protein-domain-containing protein [Xylaria curta]
MSVSGQLCRTCAALPFDPSCPPFGEEHYTKFPTVYTLGTLTQIAKRQCVFCKLVIVAIQRIQQTEQDFQSISPDQEIRIWWLLGGPRGIHIILPSKGSPVGTVIGVVHEPGMSTSRNINSIYTPIATTQIDFNKIKQWLCACTLYHQAPCRQNLNNDSNLRSLFSELRLIRFIDVNKGCLVEQRSLSSYVCLSYVWGAVASFRLSKANKSRLMQPGAIMDAWDLLPKTIQDAVTAVRMLGENYLWVDSLCLVQNDPQDMENGTGSMDLIYEFSTLTIIAASGKDANAGLPGVNAGSRVSEEHIAELIPGLRLAVYTDTDFRLEPTVYNSRAWTLQEYALSPRILCFVDNQVFFRCRQTSFSEDLWDDAISRKTSLSSIKSPLYRILKMHQPATSYRILIERYSYRTLTYSADVHNAMAGLTRRFFDRMKCRFLEGIPTAVFDHFLAFRAAKSSLKRRKGFPSYSWTGWVGPLVFWGMNSSAWGTWKASSEDESLMLDENTWIIWYKRNPSGVTSLVWDILANESFPEHSEDHPGYRRRSSFASQYAPGFSTSRTLPSDISLEATMLPSYPLLQFWTLSLYYKIGDIDALRACANVFSRKGEVLGSLYLDSFEETEYFDDTKTFEFIVLGKTPNKWRDLKLADRYFVMCLEWENNIAERRGIGDLRLDLNNLSDCFSPGPSWKEILLA